MTALNRREVVAHLAVERGDAVFVTGLGAPTYDLFAAGDSPLNFYLWGAMGAAVMTGLGLSLARPERRVVVLTGDGELLMGMGSLAVVASQRPPNLAVVVLDNEAFGETGRQPGLTHDGVDVEGIARASGFRSTLSVTRREELGDLCHLAFEGQGPSLAIVKVALSDDPPALPAREGAFLRRRFRVALGVGDTEEADE